jgi:hypothetical protein
MSFEGEYKLEGTAFSITYPSLRDYYGLFVQISSSETELPQSPSPDLPVLSLGLTT